MKVPFFDYRPELAGMRPEIDRAFARVLDSGQLINGPEVQAFERAFASYVGANHCVGVSSGTDALVLALRAVGVGPGDEVITVANGAWPTVAAIRVLGAIPRFVDVSPVTLQMDPALLESAIGEQTRCIVPVHLYGIPAPVGEIASIASGYDVRIIEDCAQAQGTRIESRHVGLFGDIGCFSFYPTKNLGAFGDAGACVTNDPELAAKVSMLREYGTDENRLARYEGFNARLDELHAALLSVRLEYLDSGLARRAELAGRYDMAFADAAISRVERTAGCSNHLYVIRTDDRAALAEELRAADIGFGIHYPVPAHRMPVAGEFGGDRFSLPETERACDEVLSLPLSPSLSDEEQDGVIAAVVKSMGKRRN